MKVACIVVAAGKGRRMGPGIKKPYVRLGGMPMLAHSLLVLSKSPAVDSIIVVAAKKDIASARSLVKRYMFDKVDGVVRGGRFRFDSVREGLKKVGEDVDIVLVHDGARPFLEAKTVSDVIKNARKFGGAVSAVPVKSTVKKAARGMTIKETPERKSLWEAQTPQGFRKDIIMTAYRRGRFRTATDDSFLVEKMGRKVRLVKGSYRNIKITTPEDLEIAKVLLEGKK